MGQLHYFFILALCLLMFGTVYPDPRPRHRRDLAKATLKTALNNFDSLLAINDDMARRIKELKGVDANKNYEIRSLEQKIDTYHYDLGRCENDKENLKVQNKILEKENRCLRYPETCDQHNPPDVPETRYQYIVDQIQRDIKSNNWTGTTGILTNVYGVSSKEYRFLKNLKHFQILPLEAAAEGYISIIKTLIINELDVNANLGSSGNTMLHEAAGGDQIEVVNYLISKGADVNARGLYHRTPIHNAADSGALESLKILLKNGADINDKDIYRLTPLHITVQRNELSTLKYLVSRKADKSIKNKENKTPLELALHLQRTEMVPFLN